MKSTCTFIAAIFLSLGTYAQTIWTGPTITFTKPNGADWTLPANQDRITDNVWITRADIQGIFNIATEDGYTTNASPADTEWAFGTTAGIDDLTFDPWQVAIQGNPPAMVGQDMVVHLISDDIYIDIRFTSWANGGQGGQGGLSYQRSTEEPSAVWYPETLKLLEVYPNPADDMLNLKNAARRGGVIVNSAGIVAMKVGAGPSAIDVSALDGGIYFLKVEGHRAVMFLKN